MSDTPETDRVVRNAAIADHPPTRLAATLTVKCEKLERERNEWAKLCGQYKQERDEARTELDQLKEGRK
jgi:hypothetical protein